MRLVGKGLTIALIALILFLSGYTAAESEGSQPQTIQTLLTHPLASEKFILSDKQNYQYLIYSEVAKEGLKFKDFLILKKIAFCESTMRHFGSNGDVLSGKKVKEDTGLFQINKFFHEAEAASMGVDIRELNGNIQYAVQLYKEQGTKPWRSSSSCWAK